MPGDQALARPPVWSAAVLVVLMTAGAVVDLRLKRVPNWLTYPAIVIALVGHTLTGGLRGGDAGIGLLGAVTGLAVGFLPLGICWLAGGIGGGDAKAAGAIGALCGWRFALAALFYGLIVAALMAVVVMIQKRIVAQTLRRVWHMLCLLLMRSRPADPAAAGSPTVPFAVALCFGAYCALIESATGIGLGRLFAGG